MLYMFYVQVDAHMDTSFSKDAFELKSPFESLTSTSNSHGRDLRGRMPVFIHPAGAHDGTFGPPHPSTWLWRVAEISKKTTDEKWCLAIACYPQDVRENVFEVQPILAKLSEGESVYHGELDPTWYAAGDLIGLSSEAGTSSEAVVMQYPENRFTLTISSLMRVESMEPILEVDQGVYESVGGSL